MKHAAARAAHPLWRRPRGWVLLAGVALVHLLWLDRLVQERIGWGSGEPLAPRIEVAFVRELAQAAPPPAAPGRATGSIRAARALPAVRAEAAAPPASQAAAAAADAQAAAAADSQRAAAPEGTASAAWPSAVDPVLPTGASAATASTASAPGPDAPPLVPPPLEAPAPSLPPPTPTPIAESTPGLIGTAATAAAPGASAASPAAAAAAADAAADAAALPSAPVFAWPPSTRLTYRLEGYYRGPLQGTARVDWLREGTRYQVHLETSLALVLSRRITSEGELTAQGLAPRRFDGEQHVLFRAARRWSQRFGGERITLADGRQVDALPGAQDEASQFVQLTWLFTTQPQLLQVGRSVELPLVLNSRQDRWVYDVREQQTLRLPFGDVATFHVTPRREAGGGVMTAEIWFAPTLQYLPVRILIRQDESTHVDLTLDNPPLQAAQ